MRQLIALITVLVLQCPALLLADGGTLRTSGHYGDFQVSVFTSPSVLRCGVIDISVLVQDAVSGKVRTDVPLTVILSRPDSESGRGIVLEQPATTALATNKLFRAAQFTVPQAGQWQASVALADSPTYQTQAKPSDLLKFELEIATPPPAWLSLAPWIGWPFGVVLLFFAHQRLAASAAR